MCRIKDMRRLSKYGWSLVYDGQLYFVLLDDCSSKVSVYIYNDVVGGYLSADAIISELIVNQLDLDSMQELDWIEEGEELLELEDEI